MIPSSAALRERVSDQAGAVAIVTAISLMTLLLMASYVLDLASLRADRSSSQTIADMAAAAAVTALDPAVAGAAETGCEDALTIAVANLRNIAGPATAITPCNDVDRFGNNYVCQAGDELEAFDDRSAEYTLGPYRILITHPVADDDVAMGPQATQEEFDGRPCQRMSVTVERAREFIIGQAVGRDGGTTLMDAVGRSRWGDQGEYASLIVLQRNDCQTLSNTGGAAIRVFDLVRDEVIEGVTQTVTYPGTITVDTVPAGCSGFSQKVIQARTTGAGALIEATGRLVAFALVSADPEPNSQTYPPGSVPTNLRSGPLPGGPPEAGPRITRAPVDDRFNCHPSGYLSGRTWSPDRFGQDIPACESGPARAYIRELREQIGAITTAAAATGAGWAVYPNSALGQTCGGGGTVNPALMGASQVFVNCTETGSISFDPNLLVLDGFTHIAFRETMRIDGSDDLEIRGNDSVGTVVYFPNGGIDHRNGKMRMRNVFGYIDAPSGGERLLMTGSAEQFAWHAVLDDTACSAGLPNAACFAPLALWSNGNAENSLAGNGGGGVVGTVFTPNAPFKVRGSSGLAENACSDKVTWADLLAASVTNVLNFESSQFFAASINTAGGGFVRLCPSPDTTVSVPLTGSGLIR